MGRITRDEYQKLTGISRATASRDLEKLKKADILVQRETGPSAYYELAHNWEEPGETI
jgi:Fic family protein